MLPSSSSLTMVMLGVGPSPQSKGPDCVVADAQRGVPKDIVYNSSHIVFWF